MTSDVDPVATVAVLDACDVRSCDPADAVRVAQHIRQVRGWLDRLEADLTSHVNSQYAQGKGAPAADLHVRSQGLSAAEARKRDRRARALDDAPSFGDALAGGRVGAEHADALANATCRIDDATKATFLGHESTLLDHAQRSTPEAFGRHCRNLLDRIARDQGIARAEQQRRATFLRRSIDPRTGMGRINGELDPELTARVFGAIDAEIAALVAASGERSDDRTHLAAHALANLVSGGHQATRPALAEVSVLIDLPTLEHGLHDASVCELTSGVSLPPATVRRLCCDAEIIPVVLDGNGVPVDVGRAKRLATRAQRRALRAMYRTCAFHGCDVPFDRCEMHHLVEWDDLGPTDLANLLPTCSRHHHLVHEGGWDLHLAPDRTLTIRQPDGEVFAICPIQMPTGGTGLRSMARKRRRRRTNDQNEPTALAS